MTGYQSKKAAALDEDGMYLVHQTAQDKYAPSDPFEKWWYYEGSAPPYRHHDWEEHTKRMCKIAWSHGANGVAQPAQERNFCSRCGKRTADLTVIHTCTPPQENT
jgi:hypothetical protein